MPTVGVDPGQTGAAVCLDNDGTVLGRVFFEKQGEYVGMDNFVNFLLTWQHHVFIEKVHAMPGQGVSSTFKFGCTFGMILGVVQSLKLPYTLVTPHAWMKILHEGVSKQLSAKQRSLDVAKRLFPCVDLLKSERSRKPHDGLVDALLLAEYGRRQL